MEDKNHSDQGLQTVLDNIGEVVDLVALNIKRTAARCGIEGTKYAITFRFRHAWDPVPGEILTVESNKKWCFKGHAYLSGKIRSKRIDAPALGLKPLVLNEWGLWDPSQDYWRNEDSPMADWERIIAGAGPRPSFEMEQVVPGDDLDGDGPILAAVARMGEGDDEKAARILSELAEADLRCLDAHSHLGNIVFEASPELALKHYQVGVEIGGLSFPENFNGVLPWGLIDNRPYLRCLHGYGLSLWRLERFDEALAIFERLLWHNPIDNLGARFLVDQVLAGKGWREEESQADSDYEYRLP